MNKELDPVPVARKSEDSHLMKMNADHSSGLSDDLFFGEDFEFQFKAITEGLGFHHGNEILKSPLAYNKGEVKKNSSLRKIPPMKGSSVNRFYASSAEGESLSPLSQEPSWSPSRIPSRVPSSTPSGSPNGMPVDRGDLAAFYGQGVGQQPTPSPELIKKVEPEEKPLMVAPTGVRLVSWIIDFFLIFFLMALVGGFFVLGADLSLSDWRGFSISKSLMFGLAGLFLIYYFFYFFLLDSTFFSLGKVILNLKLLDQNQKRPHWSKLMLRALLGLLSLPFFGIPLFFNWEGRFSKTQLYVRV